MLKRSYRRAFAGTVLASALLIPVISSPATAGTDEPKPTTEAAKKKSKKKPAPAKPSASGMVVAIDPVTKQLRQPSAEQLSAMAARSATRQVRAKELIQSRYGGEVLRNPEFATAYSVARTSNGKLKMDCVDDPKAAKNHSHAGGLDVQ